MAQVAPHSKPCPSMAHQPADALIGADPEPVTIDQLHGALEDLGADFVLGWTAFEMLRELLDRDLIGDHGTRIEVLLGALDLRLTTVSNSIDSLIAAAKECRQ